MTSFWPLAFLMMLPALGSLVILASVASQLLAEEPAGVLVGAEPSVGVVGAAAEVSVFLLEDMVASSACAWSVMCHTALLQLLYAMLLSVL